MPVLFAMVGWSQWHQPSARFVEALRPYIAEAEPAMQSCCPSYAKRTAAKKIEPMSWMQRDSEPVRASSGQEMV